MYEIFCKGRITNENRLYKHFIGFSVGHAFRGIRLLKKKFSFYTQITGFLSLFLSIFFSLFFFFFLSFCFSFTLLIILNSLLLLDVIYLLPRYWNFDTLSCLKVLQSSGINTPYFYCSLKNLKFGEVSCVNVIILSTLLFNFNSKLM